MSYYSCISVNQNVSISISDGYYVYLINCSSNDVTITLPDISLYDGVGLLFIRTDTNTSYTATISAYGSQTIDGNASKTLGIFGSSNQCEAISFSQNWVSHT